MKTKDKESNILINVNNENVYADFSYKDTNLLNESLADTITKLSNATPLKTKLNIKLTPKKDVKIEEKKFKDAFKNTFVNRMQEKKHEIARCVTTGLCILAIGILFMLLAVFVTTDVYGVPYYIVNLLAWIAVWNSVEVLTVELIQLLIERNKYKKIKNAKLIFEEPKTTKRSAK